MVEPVPVDAARGPASGSGWNTAEFREHAGLYLTLGYLLLIAMGLVYEAWLFARFRVNILYYAEAVDFLLVPFREPLVTVVSLAAAPLWILYMKGAKALDRKVGWKSKAGERIRAERPEMVRLVQLWTSVAGIMLWSIVFSSLYAKRVALQIRSGERKAVEIHIAGEPAVTGPLIGTTGNFFFVYDAAANRTRIVPVENVLQVVVDSRRKSDIAAEKALRDGKQPGSSPRKAQ